MWKWVPRPCSWTRAHDSCRQRHRRGSKCNHLPKFATVQWSKRIRAISATQFLGAWNDDGTKWWYTSVCDNNTNIIEFIPSITSVLDKQTPITLVGSKWSCCIKSHLLVKWSLHYNDWSMIHDTASHEHCIMASFVLDSCWSNVEVSSSASLVNQSTRLLPSETQKGL